MSQLLKESDMKDKIRVLGEATMAINNLWWRCRCATRLGVYCCVGEEFIVSRYKQQAQEQPANVMASLKGVQTKFVEIWGIAVEAKRLSELAAPAPASKLPPPAKKSDKAKGAAAGGGGGAEAAEAKDKPQPPSLQVQSLIPPPPSPLPPSSCTFARSCTHSPTQASFSASASFSATSSGSAPLQ